MLEEPILGYSYHRPINNKGIFIGAHVNKIHTSQRFHIEPYRYLPIPIVRRIADEPQRIQIIPAIMSVEWKTDPLHGNFNPGTPMGHKIFLEKTKGLGVDTRFDLTKANAMEIRKYLLSRENNMGDKMRKIPIE